MSYVITAPDMMASAATDVAIVGSSLSEANAAAAAPTTNVIAAAGDEVSAAIASLFSSHGTAFQALSARAAAFHSEFVQALNAGAGAYASTEAAVAKPLQTLAQVLPVPNVAVSFLGQNLVQLGTATAGGGGLAVAIGANSDATAPGPFNVALALGPGSDATVLGSYNLIQTSQFNSAIAIGTNDVAVAGGNLLGTGGLIEAIGGVPGSHDHAFVLGNGSTADAGYGVGPNGATSGGRADIAVVLGNDLTATATGTDRGADIVTPLGTL